MAARVLIPVVLGEAAMGPAVSTRPHRRAHEPNLIRAKVIDLDAAPGQESSRSR